MEDTTVIAAGSYWHSDAYGTIRVVGSYTDVINCVFEQGVQPNANTQGLPIAFRPDQLREGFTHVPAATFFAERLREVERDLSVIRAGMRGQADATLALDKVRHAQQTVTGAISLLITTPLPDEFSAELGMVARGLRSKANPGTMIDVLVQHGWVELNADGRYVLTDSGKAELI